MKYKDAKKLAFDAPETFFETEKRSGYEITYETKRMWACQLNLLSEFQKVCNRHGLHFWLDSGTLLGAVRHKGYIPWDDDIDVAMFRNDYDRLVSIAKKEFKKPFIFQTAYTEKDFVRGHAQLRDSRTSAIIPVEIYKEFNQGVFIDIFVLDGVTNDAAKVQSQKTRAANIRKRLELLATPLQTINRNDWLKKAQAALYKLIYPTMKAKGRLYAKYENIFKETPADTCEFIDKNAFTMPFRKIDKHIYDNTIYMDFEYLKLPVPRGYDKLLKIFYGDYMTPVMAPSMHGNLIIDLDTPSDIKIKEMRKCRQ